MTSGIHTAPALHRGRRFIAVGVAASLLSLVVQQCALAFTHATELVTVLRLGVALPLVYWGYSRYVLADTFEVERARIGALSTELRMVGRVASSLGASIAAKLLLEPFITAFLLQHDGPRSAGLSVLLADYTYGPLVNYLVLQRAARSVESPSTSMAPRTTALSAAALPKPGLLFLRTVFALLGALHLWRRPRDTTGEFATMSALDKLHWLYKADRPLLTTDTSLAPSTRIRREVAGAEVRLTLNAVGDLLPYPGNASSERGPLYSIARLLFSADVTFANLECPIAETGNARAVLHRSMAPKFAFTPLEFNALCSSGDFDVVSTANNHAMDAGPDGICSTLEALEKRGVLAVGTHRTQEEASQPRILSRRGVKIGFVAATFGVNAPPSEKNPDISADVEPLNALWGEGLTLGFRNRINASRDAGAQLVIASLHWGHEFELGPRAGQRQLARRLSDWGVDVILGHHPHVIQPFELISSSVEPQRRTLVFYSLGSLTKPLNYPAYALAAVASVEIAFDASGRAAVESAELVPVVQCVALEQGQPRARIERLVDVDGSGDHELSSFVSEAAVYADHVLGPDWRCTSASRDSSSREDPRAIEPPSLWELQGR